MKTIVPVNKTILTNALAAKGLFTKEVEQAFQVVEQAQSKQSTKDGSPFLENHIYPVVLEVVNNCFKNLDEHVIATALLHDILEDTEVTATQLEKVFPKTVTRRVRLLTRQPESKGADNEARLKLSKLYIQQIIKSDDATRYIKLADRIVNLTLIERIKKDKPEILNRYIKESIELFIPLAEVTSASYKRRIITRVNELKNKV